MTTKAQPPAAPSADTMVPFWTPTSESMKWAEMTRFMRVVNDKHNKQITTYAQLWEWCSTRPLSLCPPPPLSTSLLTIYDGPLD